MNENHYSHYYRFKIWSQKIKIKKNTKHRQFQGKKLTIKPPQPTKKKEEEEKTQQHNQITYLGNALDAPVSHHMNPPRHQCDPKDRPHQNPRNQTHVPIVHSKFSRENQNIPRKYQRNTTRTQIKKKKYRNVEGEWERESYSGIEEWGMIRYSCVFEVSLFLSFLSLSKISFGFLSLETGRYRIPLHKIGNFEKERDNPLKDAGPHPPTNIISI